MSSWDKSWAMCFSGKRVYPFELKVSDILIEDIAHALAMQARYNGHVSRFYSVGEHCIRIAQALFRDTGDAVLSLTGLLHDAGEAYTGDFTRPVKNSMREVGEILHAAEDRNELVIFEAFGILDNQTAHRMAHVKEYDRRIIVDEKEALFGADKPWDWDLKPLEVPIIGYSRTQCMGMYNYDPERVKEEYLSFYHDLARRALHS